LFRQGIEAGDREKAVGEMGRRLGVIAGSGEFPVHVCREASKKGLICTVACIKGEADDSLPGIVDDYEWFEAHEIGNVIAFFKKNQVSEAVFAGKIDHRIIYKSEELQKILPVLLGSGKGRSPTALIRSAIDIFSTQGIAIVDPTPYIASAFCEAGVLTASKPSPRAEEQIHYGWDIAKKLADFDIGQTVVVKGNAVVAVEGMEGTDRTIERAGELAGKGIVAVKVSRSSQDPRIDLPAVGLRTVESLVRAGGHALGFEAKKIPFFHKEKAVALADAHGISIIAK
jgi:DUF1009 family protein